MAERLNIAIDGPAGAGKSTVARRLAAALQYRYVDSGAIYRAFTLHCLETDVDLDDEGQVNDALKDVHIDISTGDDGAMCLHLNGDDVSAAIRTNVVSQAVSKMAQFPKVRQKVFDHLRQLAVEKGVVMDGRDIGTVVLPEADLKVFLTASTEERAKRRYEELSGSGGRRHPFTYNDIFEAIVDRDRRDRSRTIAPLRQAPDAILIDTTGMPVDDVVEKLLSLVRKQGVCGAVLDR